MTFAHRTLALAPLACLLLSGCRVVEHKNGDKENVDISTPFGGMHVNTNSPNDTAAIGIKVYPGAVPLKDDDKDTDTHSANVDMSFGSFHLGVKAASFQSSDQPAKVIAFYRKELSQYGDVIECRGNNAVGTPTRTSQGLGCDDHNSHTNIKIDDNDHNDIELKTGSQLHQHIVGVESRDGGTKIGLVALDLPSHLSDHDSKDSE
jgi:hypothetical protein